MPVPIAFVHSVLTPRELEIFEAVLRQQSTRQIAADRGLRYQTVKNYLTTIYDKLGVANRIELCAEYAEYASDRGWPGIQALRAPSLSVE
jgi:DNA-binding CsgD family transcriptional regulator